MFNINRKQNKKTYQICLTPRLMQQIDAVSRINDLSRSFLVGRVLEDFMQTITRSKQKRLDKISERMTENKIVE